MLWEEPESSGFSTVAWRPSSVSLAAAVLVAVCVAAVASAQPPAPAPIVGASAQPPGDSALARPPALLADDGSLEPALEPDPGERTGTGVLEARGEAGLSETVRVPRLDEHASDRPGAPGRTAPAFRDLFTSLDDDLGRLATRQSALMVAVGAGLALAAHTEDRDATAVLHGSALARRAAPPGTAIGNGATQLALAFGTYALGRAAGSTRAASLGADLVRAQLLTQAITYGLKTATHRTRPDGTAQAFPSGHASATFATATVLQRHLGWKVGVPAYALAGYVAASRLASNRHYPSDVIFGAALGTVIGRSVTLGSGRVRFAVEPLASPGGAGIAFTRVP
jgi:membrane-associated phospholipid phosphatase